MVRYSNGIEMNGHGRKSKSPDIAMAPIRNGNGVHQVKPNMMILSTLFCCCLITWIIKSAS